MEEKRLYNCGLFTVRLITSIYRFKFGVVVGDLRSDVRTRNSLYSSSTPAVLKRARSLTIS